MTALRERAPGGIMMAGRCGQCLRRIWMPERWHRYWEGFTGWSYPVHRRCYDPGRARFGK